MPMVRVSNGGSLDNATFETVYATNNTYINNTVVGDYYLIATSGNNYSFVGASVLTSMEVASGRATLVKATGTKITSTTSGNVYAKNTHIVM